MSDNQVTIRIGIHQPREKCERLDEGNDVQELPASRCSFAIWLLFSFSAKLLSRFS